MSGELGPIEIDCDAPAYPVVRACRRLGFCTPQDVRWCRVNRSSWQPGGGLLGALVGRGTCTCGHSVPTLESYTFTFVTGNQASYYLAQCDHCRTIYWDKV
jgi:hypothetical protein